MLHQHLLVLRNNLVLALIAQQPFFHYEAVKRQPGDPVPIGFPLFQSRKLLRDASPAVV